MCPGREFEFSKMQKKKRSFFVFGMKNNHAKSYFRLSKTMAQNTEDVKLHLLLQPARATFY